jgi:hypothetical protein
LIVLEIFYRWPDIHDQPAHSFTGKLLFKTKASLLKINLSFFSWKRVTWDLQARERGYNAFDYYNANAQLKQVGFLNKFTIQWNNILT